MLDKLNEIEKSALESLADVKDQSALDAWRVANLGRSSPLMQVFSGLGKLSKEEKPAVGAAANKVKVALEAALEERSKAVKDAMLAKSLEEEVLDVTLPGRKVNIGRLHPSTQQLRRVLAILAEMGFQVYTSREVESDEMNFQLLNFAPHHPAREMQDSFYIEAEGREDNPILMRTHTSPGQIRAMREAVATNPQNPPPIRIALPGMCFRYEQITARSEIQFNQVEGLAVGEGITFSRPERHADRFCAPHVRRACKSSLPRLVLPVHGANRRSGCGMFRLRRKGMPGLQEFGLARNPRLRHGASDRFGEWRLRPQALHRLCLRHGTRTPVDAAKQDQRHPLLLG